MTETKRQKELRQQHKLRETFREHMDAAVQLGEISDGYANYACDVLQNCVVSSTPTPSLAAPESETEEWTVPESDTENDGLYNIDTGRCVLRRVTTNYQKARDVCFEANTAIARLQQRVKELEGDIGVASFLLKEAEEQR